MLAIVTATLDPGRSAACRFGWTGRATQPVALYTVQNGTGEEGPQEARWRHTRGVHPGDRWTYRASQILGVVPAYAIGVQKALEDGHEIIACLHDDLEIEEYGWDTRVLKHFKAHPSCGLLGFGGALGLGAGDIYQTPYNPMQLARQRFGSNMRHAEAHGERWLEAQRVACLDGFSLIGRRAFWQGWTPGTQFAHTIRGSLFSLMQDQGVYHHFYDGAAGCYAFRLGWEVWFLPVSCHHLGGVTAVADPRYHQWADAQRVDPTAGTGDQQFWLFAHQWGYSEFRDCLPIRVAP